MDASCSIDGLTLLAPMSLHVDKGEAVIVRGANGAGKTTLLRLITGQSRPSSGRVTVDGVVPSLADPSFRRRLAAMLGLPPFARDLTLIEHATLVGVTWQLGFHASSRAAHDVIGELGLGHLGDRFPHELSSGQMQLAGLALTLVRPAPLLVLDEPEQRLDSERVAIVAGALRRRREAGTTLLIATHSDALADAIGGRSVAVGAAA